MATLLNVHEMEGAMRTAGALLLTVILIVVAFVAVSYVTGTGTWTGRPGAERTTVGTTGKVDVNAAREQGAEVGEKMAVAAEKVKETAAEAALTSKIKAKMVLDDYVKARAIDVTTNGSTVTLSGTVGTADERERAIRIARETAGVTQVVDRLKIEK
jgi:hyperosmotically inducible periplasmic protein